MARQNISANQGTVSSVPAGAPVLPINHPLCERANGVLRPANARVRVMVGSTIGAAPEEGLKKAVNTEFLNKPETLRGLAGSYRDDIEIQMSAELAAADSNAVQQREKLREARQLENRRLAFGQEQIEVDGRFITVVEFIFRRRQTLAGVDQQDARRLADHRKTGDPGVGGWIIDISLTVLEVLGLWLLVYNAVTLTAMATMLAAAAVFFLANHFLAKWAGQAIREHREPAEIKPERTGHSYTGGQREPS